MDRKAIKQKLVDMFEDTKRVAFTDINDNYRIYCMVEDSNGFWDTYIHCSIDDNKTKVINLLEKTCELGDEEGFRKTIDELLDDYVTCIGNK